MNITRENLSDLELCIKVDIEENDYIENVTKQLKEYQHKAVIPGFRKGMAPKSLIERMYKPAVVGDAVQNTLNTSLFKYIDDEKLHILGMPMSNDEKTGEVDFAKGTSFTFYFDVAVAPEFEIAWDKVDVKYNQVKVTAKDVDTEMNNVVNRYGKFETPESVAAGDIMYGKVVELDKNGTPKEGGVETFVSLNLLNLKDAELLPLFEGKKAEEKIVFNMAKAFPVADIERALHMDNATAKKFKSDVELTLSGISRIIPHEINDELFQMVFPGQTVKDADAFRKMLQKEIEKANAEQSDYLFVNQVRTALVDQFTAPLPENFLKRWFASRGDKDMTPESIEADWTEKYLPSLKWELIESKLEDISPVEPTNNQIVDYIKDILRRNDNSVEGETKEQAEQRLEQAARSIAADRQNIRQVVDRLYADNLAKLFKDQVKPEVEKVSAKEFSERAKA
ncbi:MAG: trigger factor [Bacteroidales bacterium]|nr:trigger factor [Bacteroidales bacterium]